MTRALPSKWRFMEIGEIAEIITGTTPSKKISEYYGGEIPFVTPVELDSDIPIITAPTKLTKKALAKSRILPKDSILVSCIGTLGKVAVAGRDLVTNQQINAAVFNKKIIHSRYAFYACKRIVPDLKKLASSTTLPIVNKSKFSKIRIPVPPLPEQKRIAAILDKADAIRRKRQQAIKLADEFLRSIFLDMFGDPITNPKGWPAKKIKELAEIIVPTRDKPKSFTGNVPWVTLPDIEGLFINTSKNRLTHDEAKVVQNRLMPKGTILMSCAGSLGVTAFGTRDLYANQQFYGLYPLKKIIEPIYLFFNLHVRPAKFFRKLAGTVTISFFSKSKAGDILVGLPPPKLQRQFVQIFAKQTKEISIMHKHQDKTHLMFNSLNQRAFSGEL